MGRPKSKLKLFPNPNDLFETLVIIAYLGIGITLLSAVFSSTAYYVDQFHFVLVKGWVKENWGHHWLFRPKKTKTGDGKMPLIKNGTGISVANGTIQ